MTNDRSGPLETAYVVDTSVFIHDPNCIDRFGEAIIVVPLRVVEELDAVKSRADARGAYAREASRQLESYRCQGDLRKQGVVTEKGGRLFIAYSAESWDALNGLGRGLTRNNDNLILLVAKNWKKHNPDQNVIIVTQDINMRIKAAALEMETDEYTHGENGGMDELYTGHTDISIEDEGVFQGVSSDLYRNQTLDATVLENNIDLERLRPNQCCSLRNGDRFTLAIYKPDQNAFVFVPKPAKGKKSKQLRPRNESQCFAYAQAMDPDVSLLTLQGRAGAGKTLMALMAAYDQLSGRYKRVIVYRPIYEVGGKELGYLPGDIDKKFGPWARPIMDNLELIFEDGNGLGFNPESMIMGEDNIEIETERGSISISPIIFIRGRSLHDSFVIVDEAQNLSPNDIKSLVTRAGRGTKVVITGDPTQIDNRYLDVGSNGLVCAIRNFSKKRWPKFAHVSMMKSERSELADIGAQIL